MDKESPRSGSLGAAIVSALGANGLAFGARVEVEALAGVRR